MTKLICRLLFLLDVKTLNHPKENEGK